MWATVGCMCEIKDVCMEVYYWEQRIIAQTQTHMVTTDLLLPVCGLEQS